MMTVKKTVQNVENHDWKEEPYRLDPNRGYLLCRPCWNGVHFTKPFRDAKGTWHPKVANCKLGMCHCGCRPEFQEFKKKIKFTGEGQTSISMENPITIGVKD